MFMQTRFICQGFRKMAQILTMLNGLLGNELNS